MLKNIFNLYLTLDINTKLMYLIPLYLIILYIKVLLFIILYIKVLLLFSVSIFCFLLLFDLLGIDIDRIHIHMHRIYQVSIGTLVTYKLLATYLGYWETLHVHAFRFGERKKHDTGK